MVGHDPALMTHHHLVQVGGDLDHGPDHGRVHLIVIAGHPHVVVPAQPHPGAVPDRRGDRWQREHRGPVGGDQFRQPGGDGPHPPCVGPAQPVAQLAVEVGRTREGAPGQEGGFEVTVGRLDDALGFRVVGT